MSKQATALFIAGILAGAVWWAAAQDSGGAPAGRGPGRGSDRTGPRREGERPPRREPLTDQEEAELLTALEKHWPDIHSRAMEIKESQPLRYKALLRGMWRRYEEIRDMPDQQRKWVLAGHEARHRIMRLRRAYAGTEDPAKREAIQAKIAQAVADGFKAEQKRFAYRLEQLEANLKRMRGELHSREQNREKIIADRVDRILQGELPQRHDPGHGRGPDTRPGR